MRLIYSVVFLLLAGPCVAFEAEVSAQTFIDASLAAWEAKYEECKTLERDRPLPAQAVLDRLSDHEDALLRRYLVSHSHLAMEACTRQAAGDLSYAILAVANSNETTPAEKEEAMKLGEMLHVRTWAMRKAGHELPADMRKALGEIDYFAEPFSGFRLLEALNIR